MQVSAVDRIDAPNRAFHSLDEGSARQNSSQLMRGVRQRCLRQTYLPLEAHSTKEIAYLVA